MNALDCKGEPVFPGDYVKAFGKLYKVVHVNNGSSIAKVWLEADDILQPNTQTVTSRILKVSSEDVLAMKLKEQI